MFVYLKCRCGRSLRARRSPTAGFVQCWDCGAEVKVRPYRPPRRATARVGDLMATEEADRFAAIALLAIAIAAVLPLPIVGPPLALGLLTAGAVYYVRRLDPDEDPEAGPEAVAAEPLGRSRSRERARGPRVAAGGVAAGADCAERPGGRPGRGAGRRGDRAVPAGRRQPSDEGGPSRPARRGPADRRAAALAAGAAGAVRARGPRRRGPPRAAAGPGGGLATGRP